MLFRSDDPYWYNNNFSQLGDRTTFAATMFNSTLILAGVCVIIVSYFAVSELITTHRLRVRWQLDHAAGEPTAHGHDAARSGDAHGDATVSAAAVPDEPEAGRVSRHARASGDGDISHFALRTTLLMGLLTLAGVFFIGIGTFRYTPHPQLHDFFARGLPVIMSVLLAILPWLAPQLSRAMFVIGDLGVLLCAGASLAWMQGGNTLTNVEALSGLVFLGWFIVFARQIAAIEADRVAAQLVYAQLHAGAARDAAGTGRVTSLESRIASDR